MKLSFIQISFLVSFTFLSQSFAEVYTTGSAVDNNNNIIVIGYCLGNVRIAGDEYTITTPTAFILKLNSDGEKIWVKFINSTQSIKANAVAVDTSGNIYITGEFSGVVNFDNYTLTAQGIDAFIVKYNSYAEVSWVKHGTSPGTARGNDIFVKNSFVFVCGFGETITFDSLYNTGEGFTVIYNTTGNAINLFKTVDDTYKINTDMNNNVIVYAGSYSSTFNSYFPTLSKFSFSGDFIWGLGSVQHSQSIISDADNNIFSFSGFLNNTLFLKKFDSNGNSIASKSFSPGGLGKDIILNSQNDLFLCGLYTNTFIFGNTTIQSAGLKDFFIAMIDTSLNPIWTKHGGGSYDDELINISLTNDGNIICNGNFIGAVTVDTIQITGGISTNDKWVGILKYDLDGNLIWAKKLVENYFVPTTVNWFPLEVGNKFQYYSKSYSWPHTFRIANTKLFQVTDSVWNNNKKYYSVEGFFKFNQVTRIRYDEETQRIMVLYQIEEYPFMDFSKVEGEVFQQIQKDGSFLNTTIIADTLVVFEDTVFVKGFYNSVREFGPPPITWYVNSWNFFAPEMGWVIRDEECSNPGGPTDLFLIEHLIFKEGQRIHKKHNETTTLIFQPVTFIAEGNSLLQNFIVYHPFSKQNVPASNGYFSYINSYLLSFYFNGTDTIWNAHFSIQQTSEKDFSLNYQFDTTKYNQGYHLYYRIAAVDKGIIADTFYSPQTGYYKLYWRDSTTSVTQTEFEALTYSLSQNYPNPFNPVSKIVFTIPKRQNVSLKVYDILGSEISTLVSKELDAGKYEVDFSGKDLSSGIYIYQIKAGAFRETKKMILMR